MRTRAKKTHIPITFATATRHGHWRAMIGQRTALALGRTRGYSHSTGARGRRIRLSATLLPVALAVTPFAAHPAHTLPLTTSGAVYDWLQFDGNARHSGNNTGETALGAANVGHLRRLYRVTLPSFIDGAPVYLHAAQTRGGVRDLLFATTYAGQTLALDARTGATVWRHGRPSGQLCPAPFWKHVQTTEPCYTYSSPAVDPNRRYVYGYALDGYAHKYDAGTGAETIGGGWPEIVTRKPGIEKVSSALAVARARSGTAYLYVTTSSYGDGGNYQGHLTTVNLDSGVQHVFNAMCSDQTNAHFAAEPGPADCPRTGAGIWGRAGVVYDADTDRVYLATGNGPYNPTVHDWGQSVVALHPDGTGAGAEPLDRYTPANYAALNDNDADLGSTDPAILPPLAHSAVAHLAVQGAKDGTLRLLNLDNLSGRNGGLGHGPLLGGEVGASLKAPQGEGVLSQPAVWVNPANGGVWVFVGNWKGLTGLRVMAGRDRTPALHVAWSTRAIKSTSPLVVNNVLYCASAGHIQALDPTSGTALWGNTGIGLVHWSSPVVADGVLYIADKSGALTAYTTRQAARLPPS